MKLIKESRLEGEFEGFDGDTIFTLITGEKYQQVKYKYKYKYAYMPRIKVYKDGTRYYLEFANIEEKLEVRKL